MSFDTPTRPTSSDPDLSVRRGAHARSDAGTDGLSVSVGGATTVEATSPSMTSTQRWLGLALAAVSIVTGALVLAWPAETIKVAAILFGIQLITHGAYRMIQSVLVPQGAGTRVLLAVMGVLSIVVGVMCLRHLLQTVAVLTLMLGLFWLVGGVLEVADAVSGGGREGRGWAVANGLLSMLAGVVVLSWPGMSLATLTVLLGAWLIVGGVITGVGVVMAARKATT